MFDNNEVQLLPAAEIDENVLAEYYRKTFPHRKISMPLIWKWLNNSKFYNNKIPIVLSYKGELIGHEGMRPVNLRIDNDTLPAGWPIDLRVNPGYRNHGLGKLLSNSLFPYSKIQMAFGNRNSYPLFKKLGWIDGGNTYTHFLPIKPLDHPKFSRTVPDPVINFINTVTRPYFSYKIKKKAKSEYQIKEISVEGITEFAQLRESNNKKIDLKKKIIPQRNFEYLKWRILESPNKHKYKLFYIDKISAIILMNNNRGRYIDILSISNLSCEQIIYDLIVSVCSFATDSDYSYVRLCSSFNDLNKRLKKEFNSFRKEYNFTYYTQDIDLKSKISDYKWVWELIDSDFEYMEPVESELSNEQ
jgi:hypothetical protein